MFKYINANIQKINILLHEIIYLILLFLIMCDKKINIREYVKLQNVKIVEKIDDLDINVFQLIFCVIALSLNANQVVITYYKSQV